MSSATTVTVDDHSAIDAALGFYYQSLYGLLVIVKETLGDAWLTPDLFRLGASTLTNDLLMQLVKEATGSYQSEDYFSKD